MNRGDIIFTAFALLCFVALLVYEAERISILNEQVHNFSHPAQLQIHDTQDPMRFPFIVGIKCEVLPCGQFTGRQRECVVSCNVSRRAK